MLQQLKLSCLLIEEKMGHCWRCTASVAGGERGRGGFQKTTVAFGYDAWCQHPHGGEGKRDGEGENEKSVLHELFVIKDTWVIGIQPLTYNLME